MNDVTKEMTRAHDLGFTAKTLTAARTDNATTSQGRK